MKINDLAIVESAKSAAPRPRMIKHKTTGGAQRLLESCLGTANNLWIEPDKVASYAGYFPILEKGDLGRRRIRVDIELKVGNDPDALAGMAQKLLGSTLSELVHDTVADALNTHFTNLDDATWNANPVFPARSACENWIRTRLEMLGLKIATGPNVQIEPHIDVAQEVFELNAVEVVPVDSGRRQPVDVVFTLTAPPAMPPSHHRLLWLLNEIPVRGTSGSIEEFISSAIAINLNNAYTIQELRREPTRIASELTNSVQKSIVDKYGFHIAVKLVDVPGSENQSIHTGKGQAGISLIGTGRTVAFEIEFIAEAIDDDLLIKAFDNACKTGADKTSREDQLSSTEEAATTGNISVWIKSLALTASTSALDKAVGEIPVETLPRFGAFPEDATLNLDKRVNELANPLLARSGLSAQIRVVPQIDPMLHMLRNGIQIDTKMQDYELAQTSTSPKMRFKYSAYLPPDAATNLLIPYFQDSGEDEPLLALTTKAATRTQQIVASVMGQMSPDAYLDTTGNMAAIRNEVEEKLDNALSEEFGLRLQPPLVVTAEPDRVQERYNALRSETRRLKVPLRLQRSFDGEPVEGVLSLQYQVDRLANPHADEGHSGTIAAWERFRNWANRYETLDAHLDAFDSLMSDSIRSPLEKFPAEAYAKTELHKLQPQVGQVFANAGAEFGLDVRVFLGTVNVDFDTLISADPQLESERRRLVQLTQDQERDQKKLDQLEFGGTTATHGSIFDADEPEDDIGKDAEIKKLKDIVSARDNRMKELRSNIQGLSGDPSKLLEQDSENSA